MIQFTKMQGLGNDYVYFDAIHQEIEDVVQLARFASDRHFGVGGDGIILICPSQVADFKMRMFNCDGSEAEMCGNGIRCVGKFVYDKGLTQKKKITVETLACGTGACASAVACHLLGRTDRNVEIELLGGKLQIEWNEENHHVYMTGPAVTVFEGCLEGGFEK